MRENKRDVLFYTDLIYKIKKLAGFEIEEDKVIESRIEERERFKTSYYNGIPVTNISDFNAVLYTIIVKIIELSNKNSKFTRPNEIALYPELVEKVISELEEKVEIMKNSSGANIGVSEESEEESFDNLKYQKQEFDVLAVPSSRPFVMSHEKDSAQKQQQLVKKPKKDTK